MQTFSKSVFLKRREKVLSSMKDNSVMIIESAKYKKRNGDNDYPYKQDSNFFYLTGFQNSSSVLLLRKRKDKRDEILFVEENNPHTELWLGRKPSAEEVKEETGIKSVSYIKDFDMYLRSAMSGADAIYLDYYPVTMKEPLSYEHEMIKSIRERFPHISSVNPASTVIFPVRLFKDKEEISAIERAVEITGQGLLNAMRNAKPGMYEYEVQADIEYMYMKNGCRMPAFPSIVAAGINATTLHYTTNDTVIESGDLILCDIGAEYLNYSADITRVFPVSKKFKGKAKDLYSEMVVLQEKIIGWCSPGTDMKELNEKSGKAIGKLLKSFRYIKDESDYRKYYAHSIGHMLGLDTHDVSNTVERENHILKKGMVLTIEPGIYIPEDKIGIRIEDDILITEKGRKNLSAGIPKEISDIEKAMVG